MKTYWLKRLLLIPLTLFGIIALNFVLIQMTPGGPVEHMMMKIQGSTNASEASSGGDTKQRIFAEQMRQELNKQFGFDKPLLTRFVELIKNYAIFNFGKSFYQDKTVLQLIKENMPVFLLIYLIAIPLGIRKAIKVGTRFDKMTTAALTIAYAVPAFLLAISLVIFFAGGHYLNWFPLRGLVSDNWAELSWFGKIGGPHVGVCIKSYLNSS